MLRFLSYTTKRQLFSMPDMHNEAIETHYSVLGKDVKACQVLFYLLPVFSASLHACRRQMSSYASNYGQSIHISMLQYLQSIQYPDLQDASFCSRNLLAILSTLPLWSSSASTSTHPGHTSLSAQKQKAFSRTESCIGLRQTKAWS